MKTIKEAKETPVVAEAEVLVIGGGPAGIAAATAAARGGARVILIERYGYLGGLATGGLVLLMDHLFDSSGRRCIDGITWELMCRLEKLGGLAGTGTPRLHADSEMLKILADQICVESGVILRFHSWVVDAVMDGGRVTGVIAESKAGRHALLADICIDASGDGDLAAFAGASFETHTMRIGLNSKIGGVDRDEFAGWKEEHPDEAAKIRSEVLSRGGCPLGMGPTPYSDEGVFWVNNLGFAQREDETKPIPDGNDSFNGGLSAIDVETLTWVELESRKRILRGIEYYRKHVPGYQKVQLLAIASQLGVRDSRRIIGLHRVSRDEMEKNVYFEDTVGLTGMSFQGGNHLRVPYRALVPEKTDGLLIAGRCIDSDNGVIHSVRLIPPCMMTGEAAGAAAALCVKRNIEPRELPYEDLRKKLAADGAMLED